MLIWSTGRSCVHVLLNENTQFVLIIVALSLIFKFTFLNFSGFIAIFRIFIFLLLSPLLKVISDIELKTSPRTGKLSIKNMETPRPPIDRNKLERLKELVYHFCPGMDQANFIKNCENLQKVLKRK